MYGAVYTGRECKIATAIKDAMDQVHKFPHMGKFLHLIQKNKKIFILEIIFYKI